MSSILAHGLLASLVVRPEGELFAVVAGKRRLDALKYLSKHDPGISPDYLVPCRVIGEDDMPSELSLAENMVRVAMHPVDQYVAFAGLAEQGRASRTSPHVSV